MSDRFQGLDHYTWQRYPADVPVAGRRTCSRCGAPGTLIRYRHDEIFGPATAFSTLSNHVDDLFTVYCDSCAEKAGYSPAPDGDILPPHLNRLQHWIARALDLGDPDHRT
jgi:hypothetical protein